MHVILGTAGHIDHGKTALIKALTGIETDRLKEERERGISIDLGFARFAADGVTAGVVDVPGHERFIRNMLAGAHGIDVVLLVVAADDGVMPQTEEHLDILHLLGARRGVVAMTKVDLVDAARRRAVHEEIEILLSGTGLEGAPVVEVSTVTGEGLPALRTAIAAAVRDYRRPDPAGCFRLPIDRAFVMRGHGVVVTGTATAGSVRAGATLRVLPGGAEVRVRGVQVHGEAVEQAAHGQRVALNLSGAEHDTLCRGQVVCDPELERVSARLDAWVELRPAARRPLPGHAEVRVYAGAAEAMGKIIWLDGREALAPRQATYAQLVLREPIAVFGGDRFILRAANASATIGGGIVLQPFAVRPAQRIDPRLPALAALRAAATPLARLHALLALDGAFAVTPAALAAAANLRARDVRELLAAEGVEGSSGQRFLDADVHGFAPEPRLVIFGDAEAYTTADKWKGLCAAVREALAAFHRQQPRQPGMEMESLRSQLAADLAPKIFRAVVERLAVEQVLVRADSVVRLPSHTVGLEHGEVRVAEQALAALSAAGFTPPDAKQLAADLGIAAPRLGEILLELERTGRVARATPDLYFAADAVERARDLIRAHVAQHGEITAAAFRDLIAASRKFSIALLNYLDRTGFTLRLGDIRKLRR